MLKGRIDVFLSSDQKEFEKERIRLSKIICEISFCSCTPLEKRGADTTDVIRASLKASKECDLYVGIFGNNYSETTIKEYKQAVKNHKSCLCYVKKIKNRDKKLETFIDDDLKNRFKYHEFKGKTELYKQIKMDIEKLIFETLLDGLAFRKREKQKAINIIESERKTEGLQENQHPLSEAQNAYEKERYLECLVKTRIVLEKKLSKKLSGIANTQRLTFGRLISLATRFEILDKKVLNSLVEISHIRNSYVHGMKSPNREETLWALNAAKQILENLEAKQKTYSIDKIRTTYPNAYEKWTSEEDAQLIKECQNNMSVHLMSKVHKRTKGAINSRLSKLGLTT